MNWADGAMVLTPGNHLLTLLKVHVCVCVFFSVLVLSTLVCMLPVDPVVVLPISAGSAEVRSVEQKMEPLHGHSGTPQTCPCWDLGTPGFHPFMPLRRKPSLK